MSRNGSPAHRRWLKKNRRRVAGEVSSLQGLVVTHCASCGMNRPAHQASDAYYGESWLEPPGFSSSTAKRAGCQGYRLAGLTFVEAMCLRNCTRRWLQAKRA